MRSPTGSLLIVLAFAWAALLAACGTGPDPASLDGTSSAVAAEDDTASVERADGATGSVADEVELLAAAELTPRLPRPRPTPSTAVSPTPTPAPTPTSTPTPDAPAEAPAPAAEPASSNRVVVEVAWTPFATIGELVLHHPSARVERIGFHESTHDGARQMVVAGSAVRPMTLQTRGRGTGSRSAADIVVDPAVQIRSPVTGTVLRAGTYVLYCDYSDGYVVVEPDGWPGWEAKVLHIDQVRVSPGDRVAAGETVIATRPTPLPFESQVDEHTAEPSWPHVHIEVVDTSIPRKPSSGGGC